MPQTVRVRRRATADIAETVTTFTDRASVASARRWRLKKSKQRPTGYPVDADQWPEADEASYFGVNLRDRAIGRRHQVSRIISDAGDVIVLRVAHGARDRLTAGDL